MSDWFQEHRGLIGYAILALGFFLTVGLIRQEAVARSSFDSRRSYDLCVSGNERTETIADAIRGVAKDNAETLVKVGRRPDSELTPKERADQEARIVAYTEGVTKKTETRLEKLKPRDCKALYLSDKVGD